MSHCFFQPFASNAVVKPINKKLTVKKERDVTSVKSENELNDDPFVSNEVQVLSLGSQIDQLKKEKENVIQELINIKSENQKLNFEVQRKGDELGTLIEQHGTDTMKLNKIIQSLKSEVSEWNHKHSTQCKTNIEQEKTISSLKHDKSELSAQLVQLRHGTSFSKQIEDQEDEEDEDEVYEVEKLISHKDYKLRKYLVRWKNFSAEHDSWVEESNLECKKLLNEYLKKKNLKK